MPQECLKITRRADRFAEMSKEQLEEQGINSVISKPQPIEVLENCFNNVKKIVNSAQTSQ